jgi:predicted DNA-binding transcriptional regulator AlpA
MTKMNVRLNERKASIQYLNEKEVSEITAMALPTLRNYRHMGKGPAYVKVGTAVRYQHQDILRWMERNRIEPRE